jgi:hypothetical protein
LTIRSNVSQLTYIAELADLLSGKAVCREGEDIGMDPAIDNDGKVDNAAAMPTKKIKKSKKKKVIDATTAPGKSDADIALTAPTASEVSRKQGSPSHIKDATTSMVPAIANDVSVTLVSDNKISDELDLSSMEVSQALVPTDVSMMDTSSDTATISIPSDGEILGVSSDGASMFPHTFFFWRRCFETPISIVNPEYTQPERSGLLHLSSLFHLLILVLSGNEWEQRLFGFGYGRSQSKSDTLKMHFSIHSCSTAPQQNLSSSSSSSINSPSPKRRRPEIGRTCRSATVQI